MLKKQTKIFFGIIRALPPPPVHWAVWDTMRSWDNFNCSEADWGRSSERTMPRMLIISFSFELRAEPANTKQLEA